MSAIGVAFSGSGTKAPAFIGALAAFEEKGHQIESYAGTSGGSIVAAVCATNDIHAATVLLQNWMNENWRHFFPTGVWYGMTHWLPNLLHKGGLCSGKFLHSYILEMTQHKVFKDITIPLSIVATNINGGCQVFNAKTPDVLIADAVRASLSIPFAFTPAVVPTYGTFVDGGLSDNIPADKLIKSDWKIGIRLTSKIVPLAGQIDDVAYGERLINLILKSSEDAHARLGQLKGADIVNVDTSYASGFDFAMTDPIKKKLYDTGHQAMLDYFNHVGEKE